MQSFLGVIVGLLQAAFSLLGIAQSNPTLPPATQQQVLEAAQQTVTQVTSALATSTISSQRSSSSSSISVSGMSEYTDSDFGFSFWYPSEWQVVQIPVDDQNLFTVGTVEKELALASQPGKQDIVISEVYSNNRTISDQGNGPTDSELPLIYFFDPTAHTWMVTYPNGGHSILAGTTEPADVSTNTMGGLHMLAGNERFDSDIVPLSAENFLDIRDNGGYSANYLTPTVLATDPSVATPLSAAEQEATVEAEAQAYGVTAQQQMTTFSDDALGFSVQYPASLTPGPNENVWSGLSGKLSESPFTITSGPVSLSITVSPDPTDVGNCTVAPQSSEQSVSDNSTVSINGVPFRTYSIGDAAMGQYTSTQIYKTIKNNACYELAEQVDTSRTDSDADAQAQQNAVAAGKAEIDPIVQSFTFTRDMSAAPAPTCTLKTDAFEYKLGDVMTLTWSSTGASRAAWDQDADQSTGVRTKIIPPAGTPAPNGSGPTIANIEGYQPITLDVAGDGGFGTCSTDVQVNASDAKPSITVDNIVISKKMDYTNDRNVEVTLSGTATNGGLFNNEVNVVLFDPTYPGPFDEDSVYSADRTYFYSGGTQPGVREDSLPFETWTAESYVPRGVTSVRVLAYYPFYGSGPYDPSFQPIVNEILTVGQ